MIMLKLEKIYWHRGWGTYGEASGDFHLRSSDNIPKKFKLTLFRIGKADSASQYSFSCDNIFLGLPFTFFLTDSF